MAPKKQENYAPHHENYRNEHDTPRNHHYALRRFSVPHFTRGRSLERTQETMQEDGVYQHPTVLQYQTDIKIRLEKLLETVPIPHQTPVRVVIQTLAAPNSYSLGDYAPNEVQLQKANEYYSGKAKLSNALKKLPHVYNPLLYACLDFLRPLFQESETKINIFYSPYAAVLEPIPWQLMTEFGNLLELEHASIHNQVFCLKENNPDKLIQNGVIIILLMHQHYEVSVPDLIDNYGARIAQKGGGMMVNAGMFKECPLFKKVVDAFEELQGAKDSPIVI